MHGFSLSAAAFIVLSALFFALIGREPIGMLGAIAEASIGSAYALGESVLRATPILLCALATLTPARVGQISVGAEGQLYVGALTGTGVVLVFPDAPAVLLPAMQAARLSGLWDSRVHAGLLLALGMAVLLHGLFTRTRWGLALDILRSNPRAGQQAGLSLARQIMLTMLIGGALAGLAGIAETSAVQGRLQADLSNGAGLSGFLVAWLARGDALRAIGLALLVGALLVGALLVGALLAAGDGLQMSAGVPSSATLVVQGLLFAAVLGVGGWRARVMASRRTGVADV